MGNLDLGRRQHFGRVKSQSSDVKKSNPGGADVEVVVVEFGLYDHVTTAIQRHVDSNTVTETHLLYIVLHTFE